MDQIDSCVCDELFSGAVVLDESKEKGLRVQGVAQAGCVDVCADVDSAEYEVVPLATELKRDMLVGSERDVCRI